MKKLIFVVIALSGLLFSCEISKNEDESITLKTGEWRGVLKAQGNELPFLFEVVESGGDYQLLLKNADERILLDEVIFQGDSIHIPMYIFDAAIHAKISDSSLKGYYVKNYADDYILPFEASYGDQPRFAGGDQDKLNPFLGQWEADFLDEEKVTKAIGVFEEYEGRIKGTFVRTTGDYRYLEGTVVGQSMKLSAFDGTHLYLFNATINDQGQMVGEYWSGKTWYQKWTAVKNEDYELPDPYALTYMKEGYDQFEIRFPNPAGDLVALTDARYQDKVVVIQILGSWCPNCMDETRFYVDWIGKNPGKDVEFIGLAFERKSDREYAFARIENMKQKLNVPYEVLFAGTTSQESRSEALPMLNKVMSFPTSIMLDKDHKVRRIHTGFSGPGTGDYYDKFVEEFNLQITQLLEE